MQEKLLIDRKFWGFISHLWPYLKDYKGSLAAVLGFNLYAALFLSTLPLFYSYVIDQGFSKDFFPDLYSLIFYLAGGYSFKFIAEAASKKIMERISISLKRLLKLNFFPTGVGHVNLSEDRRAIENALILLGTESLESFLLALFSFAVLLHLSTYLAFLVVVMLFAKFLIPYPDRRRTQGGYFREGYFIEAVVIVLSLIGYHQGIFTEGALVATLLSCIYFLRGVDRFFLTVPTVVEAEGLLSIFELPLRTGKEEEKESNKFYLPYLSTSVSFQNVSYCYEPDKPVLEQIDFFVRRGQAVAFVGAGGSGKSTLIRLLAGQLEPKEGIIFYDDYPLNKIDEASYRKLLGVSSQDNQLFNLSVRENILLGRLDASDEDVILAAKRAGLHEEIVLLPEGYDTLIGEEGGHLSSGKQQRLALAKALVRDPELLILDEATSALDETEEQEVIDNLLDYCSNRTLILATVHVKLASRMQYIFVMDKGRIVERGTHAELLAEGGTYAALWNKQNHITQDPYSGIWSMDVNFLKKIPILELCSEELLEKLTHQFIIESYAKGETIIKEGSFGDTFYIIIRGEVEVSKYSQEQEREEIVAVLSDGDYFGEIGLLRNEARTGTVTARSYSLVLELSRTYFNKLLQTDLFVKEIIHLEAKKRLGDV